MTPSHTTSNSEQEDNAMTDVDHTPGPFTLASGPDGAFQVEDARGYVLCARNMWPGNADESAANGVLFAVAPQLLAAAQTVLAGLNTRIEAAGSVVPVFDGIADLHDAISKAGAHPMTNLPPVQLSEAIVTEKPWDLVHGFVENYEWRGDGDYTPSESECALIEDAMQGFLQLLQDRGYFVTELQHRVKPLVWSDESAPNDYCSYNHSFADTPFGRYQIEWKGWKDYPNFTIDFGGNLLDQYPGNTLEEARAAAQAHFDAAVISTLAGQP